MTSVTVPEQRYNALVEKFAAQFQEVEAGNLRRYHGIGGLFSDFCKGVDAKKYGAKTAANLAQDLAEKGVLRDVKDVTRFLYWAKNVYEAYPEADKLSEMVKLGFTVSHAKQLFALDEDLRSEVSAQLIQDGVFISTRALGDLIATTCRAKLAKDAQHAIAASKNDPPAPAPVATAAPEDTYDPTDPDAVPPKDTTLDEAAAVAGAAKASKDPEKKGAISKSDKSIPSPNKVLNSLEKNVTRVLSEIPDAFIVIKEVAKRGFDSDAAHANYEKLLTNTKAAIHDVIEPLQELLKTIEESTAK
jgi:hypothetical protein